MPWPNHTRALQPSGQWIPPSPKPPPHENHRMFRVGRDLCGSSSPTPLPKQGLLQWAAQDLVQTGLEYLQRRRIHNLPGQLCSSEWRSSSSCSDGTSYEMKQFRSLLPSNKCFLQQMLSIFFDCQVLLLQSALHMQLKKSGSLGFWKDFKVCIHRSYFLHYRLLTEFRL